MLHKCANPTCPSVFRSLSHGKLFLLETEHAAESIPSPSLTSRRERLARRVERYWPHGRAFRLPAASATWRNW
jgi:hypothetical protein